MKFCKFLIGAGVTVAVLGSLVLIFQATMFLIFAQWYGFSIFDILQRLHLIDYLDTNIASLDQTIDLMLDVPLSVVLIVIGGLTGLAGYHVLQEEITWSRRH